MLEVFSRHHHLKKIGIQGHIMLPGRHLPNLTLSSSSVVQVAQLSGTQRLCQVGYFKEKLGTFVSSALSPCLVMSNEYVPTKKVGLLLSNKCCDMNI